MKNRVEPVTGIGPAWSAWKAGVLPLNYTDGWCPGRPCRSAPGLPVLSGLSAKSIRRRLLTALPLTPLEEAAGIEPTLPALCYAGGCHTPRFHIPATRMDGGLELLPNVWEFTLALGSWMDDDIVIGK